MYSILLTRHGGRLFYQPFNCSAHQHSVAYTNRQDHCHRPSIVRIHYCASISFFLSLSPFCFRLIRTGFPVQRQRSVHRLIVCVFSRCRHPGCQKAFSQLSNLQSHSRCHQTDKPYKCNSCYKCFSDEPSLLEHIPKHKESKHLKTHICQYCGKSYTQETYLQKHMQKHAERTDKRPPIGPALGKCQSLQLYMAYALGL